MLFHLSIDADDPQHVAGVFAEIWDGRAVPFPSVATGSWLALSNDERNATIEVYPRGTELVEMPGDADAKGLPGHRASRSPTHMAIGTRKTMDEILALCAREGWTAKYRKRGGVFGVIEIWVEGWRMIEVLTPEMQAEYLALKSPPQAMAVRPEAAA